MQIFNSFQEVYDAQGGGQLSAFNAVLRPTTQPETMLVPSELPKMEKPKRKLEWSFDMPEVDTGSDTEYQNLVRDRDRNIAQYKLYDDSELQHLLDFAKRKIRDAYNDRNTQQYNLWEQHDEQIRAAMQGKKTRR